MTINLQIIPNFNPKYLNLKLILINIIDKEKKKKKDYIKKGRIVFGFESRIKDREKYR